ncbi:protoporphyrinogen oxidase [Cohnella thailandensis]|uniref:Coproporphyrinogen III oxidase n=1 Tax=Cohnella thailandensis TaxID=557557 RepID=A0A841T114_9BACL|nr:protoporphyrinogen oxidase [Cohnella thailandensis]MBB6636088.1 protoporphyrinogen oxidase [Cohnella thailandensis]MBP1973943.1 oxygen-dependent protoporphyrinogen oxidase [Cohnella thailandensis]
MGRNVKRVAILGGGITGLSAAFYLKRQAGERNREVEVTLLEASGRLGGKVNTLRKEGFVIERGPDSFLGRKLPMLHLARDLGLLGELTGTNPQAVKTYLAHNGLKPMPKGINLGIPNNIGLFARTSLISPHGKLRALDEMRIPPREGEEDESVGDFLERRLGREMVERIAEPLLAGIHAGDLYKLSLKATFPEFREMELKYGSVIRGMMEAKRRAPTAGAQAAKARSEAVGGYPIPPTAFLTFRNGLSTVIEALEKRLREDGAEIRLGGEVVRLERSPATEGSGSVYRLILRDGSSVEADSVLFTLPGYAMTPLLAPHMEVGPLGEMEYVSVANVVLAYDEKGFNHRLDGSGFLVPHSEGLTITASTWTSSKWGHTAPADKRLIRCYVGHAGNDADVELSDEEMTARVRRDLKALMGLTAEPRFVEITRLRRGMPQYGVGHSEHVEAFRANLAAALPGVFATGASFDAVGLPDCVRIGKDAADRILSFGQA